MVIDAAIISQIAQDSAKETLLNDPGFSNKFLGRE